MLNPNISLFFLKIPDTKTCNSFNLTEKPTEHINACQNAQIFSFESGINLDVIMTQVQVKLV